MFTKTALFSLISISILSGCQVPVTFAPIPTQTFIQAQSITPQRNQSTTQSFVIVVASAFHDAWRSDRRKPNGNYEPRMKTTKDPIWIKAHKTNQVDIANTAYPSLPSDWQAENRASAQIAVQEILSEKGKVLTPQFIEKASAVIHVKWIERNTWAKGGDLDKPYSVLPEPEKQKDREALYQAIHQGLKLRILNPKTISKPVATAVAQMLKKIKG